MESKVNHNDNKKPNTSINKTLPALTQKIEAPELIKQKTKQMTNLGRNDLTEDPKEEHYRRISRQLKDSLNLTSNVLGVDKDALDKEFRLWKDRQSLRHVSRKSSQTSQTTINNSKRDSNEFNDQENRDSIAVKASKFKKLSKIPKIKTSASDSSDSSDLSVKHDKKDTYNEYHYPVTSRSYDKYGQKIDMGDLSERATIQKANETRIAQKKEQQRKLEEDRLKQIAIDKAELQQMKIADKEKLEDKKHKLRKKKELNDAMKAMLDEQLENVDQKKTNFAEIAKKQKQAEKKIIAEIKKVLAEDPKFSEGKNELDKADTEVLLQNKLKQLMQEHLKRLKCENTDKPEIEDIEEVTKKRAEEKANAQKRLKKKKEKVQKKKEEVIKIKHDKVNQLKENDNLLKLNDKKKRKEYELKKKEYDEQKKLDQAEFDIKKRKDEISRKMDLKYNILKIREQEVEENKVDELVEMKPKKFDFQKARGKFKDITVGTVRDIESYDARNDVNGNQELISPFNKKKERKEDNEFKIKESEVCKTSGVCDSKISDKSHSNLKNKLAENKLAENELAENELAEKESAEKESAEKELAEKESAEKELTEKKLAEKELAEKKLAEKELAEKKSNDDKSINDFDKLCLDTKSGMNSSGKQSLKSKMKSITRHIKERGQKNGNSDSDGYGSTSLTMNKFRSKSPKTYKQKIQAEKVKVLNKQFQSQVQGFSTKLQKIHIERNIFSELNPESVPQSISNSPLVERYGNQTIPKIGCFSNKDQLETKPKKSHRLLDSWKRIRTNKSPSKDFKSRMPSLTPNSVEEQKYYMKFSDQCQNRSLENDLYKKLSYRRSSIKNRKRISLNRKGNEFNDFLNYQAIDNENSVGTNNAINLLPNQKNHDFNVDNISNNHKKPEQLITSSDRKRHNTEHFGYEVNDLGENYIGSPQNICQNTAIPNLPRNTISFSSRSSNYYNILELDKMKALIGSNTSRENKIKALICPNVCRVIHSNIGKDTKRKLKGLNQTCRDSASYNQSPSSTQGKKIIDQNNESIEQHQDLIHKAKNGYNKKSRVDRTLYNSNKIKKVDSCNKLPKNQQDFVFDDIGLKNSSCGWREQSLQKKSIKPITNHPIPNIKPLISGGREKAHIWNLNCSLKGSDISHKGEVDIDKNFVGVTGELLVKTIKQENLSFYEAVKSPGKKKIEKLENLYQKRTMMEAEKQAELKKLIMEAEQKVQDESQCKIPNVKMKEQDLKKYEPEIVDKDEMKLSFVRKVSLPQDLSDFVLLNAIGRTRNDSGDKIRNNLELLKKIDLL